MGELNFNDLLPEKTGGSTLSFDDLLPTEEPVSRAQIKNIKGGEAGILDKAAAIIEQPGAMAWQLGSAAVGGVSAGLRALYSRVPGMAERAGDVSGKEAEERYRKYAGMSFGDTFVEEYNRVAENASNMYVPITQGGEQLTAAIGEIFHTATKALPDFVFEHTENLPIPLRAGLAAGIETAENAALLLLGVRKPKPGATPSPGGKAGGRAAPDTPPTPEEVWSAFKEKYPTASSNIEAMQIGKIRMEDFHKTDRTVYDVVERKLDTALQLTEEQKGMTFEGKMRQVFQRAAPEVPVGEIDKAVRASLDGLRQMDALRESRANTGLPLIRDPAISKDPVIVDKNGKAVTPEQAAATDAGLPAVTRDMTPEQATAAMDERANILGMSAMGRMRIQLEEAQRLRTEGKERQAYKVEQQLKQSWAKNFPYRDPTKRAEGLERFTNFNGRMTYEEAVGPMGQPIKGAPKSMLGGVGKKEGGAIKEAGGVWDPDTIENLSGALWQGMGPRNRIGGDNTEQIAVENHATRMVTNYLNRFAGQGRDPLRDLPILMNETNSTWGAVTDQMFKSATIPVRLRMMKQGKAQIGEDVWQASYEGGGNMWASPYEAVAAWVSHMGDYAREFVPLDKLKDYDFVRLARETARQDVRQAKKMEKARASGEGTTVHKEYPDGMKWVEVGTGKDKAVADSALKNEGDVMGHCVGGYCEAVHSGESKIYSLRDKKNMSHVTVEVEPKTKGLSDEDFISGEGSEPNILQIKGKQNRAPIAEYLPYVQDFVKSGKWGEVGDLQNAGLMYGRDVFKFDDFRRAAKQAGIEFKPDQLYTIDEVNKVLGPKVDVMKKQRGMIDIEGLGKLGDDTVKKAVGTAARPWSIGTPDQERPAYNMMEAMYARSLKAEEASLKVTLKDKATQLRRSIFGHDVDLKSTLEKAGPVGERARLRMVLQNTATDAARFEMEQIHKRIYEPLSPTDKVLLDKLVRDRVIIEIHQRNPKYRFPEGKDVNGASAEAHARGMARELGDDACAALSKRADAIFNVYRTELVRGYEKGLYSQEIFDKLIAFDYEPTQYINLIDPVQHFSIHGRQVSVRGSGIPFLGHGKTNSALRMDSRAMLAETIARNRNREFKNNTLQELWNLAESSPENSLVRIAGKGESKGTPGKHPPSGWTNLGVRIEGKQKEILMQSDFAEQFVNNPQGIDHWVGNVAKIASLSAPIRATAVGLNPLFPAAGIPMDLAQLWLAKGKEYSSIPPVYIAQIGKDMLSVLPDLKGKTGRYADAMEEGLGSHYMTSYGQEIFTREKTVGEKLGPDYGKIRKALSGFNKEADVWIRLAHREALMRDGLTGWEATARAVDRLDYSESGILTRSVDTIAPWTSIAMEALYKASRAAKRNPADFASKLAWVLGGYTAWNLGNMATSPETWKGIPTDDKVRGLSITYGDQLYVLDENGNRRYFYTPVRFDQTFAPLQALTVGAIEYMVDGRLPNDLMKKTMSQTLSVWSPIEGVPMMSAAAAMMNFNPYTGKRVFEGTVKPEDETKPGTHPLAVMTGQAAGMSPERIQAAFGKAVSPYNPWVAAAGMALKQVLGDTDYRTNAQTSEYFLANHLRPIVKLTNPISSYVDTIQEKEEEQGSYRKHQNDALDKLLFNVDHGKASMKDVQKYIMAQPAGISTPDSPEGTDRKRMIEYAKVKYHVDKVMKEYAAGDAPGVPPRAWWTITSSASAEVRAQEFHSKWISADDAGRKKMEKIAMALQARGTGYRSDSFNRYLMKERSLLGTDKR